MSLSIPTLLCILGGIGWVAGAPSAPPAPAYAGFVSLPSSPKIHFRHIGTTSAATEYAHLAIPIDLFELQRDIKTLKDAIYNTFPRNADKIPASDTLANIEDRLDSLISVARPPAAANREKRFIVTASIIVATFLGTVSLGASIYNHVELTQMGRRVDNLDRSLEDDISETELMLAAAKDTNHLIQLLATTQLRNTHVATRMHWLGHAATRLEQQVNTAERAITSALGGRLDVVTLSMIKIDKSLSGLRSYASSAGLTLVSEEPHDLLNVPASLTSSPTGVNILAHVPLYRNGTLMEVFQHVPLPMPAGHGLYFWLRTDDDIIAITHDNKAFKTTNMVELLADCTKLGKFYACPRGNTARTNNNATAQKNDPARCLLALFTEDHRAAAVSCEKEFTKPRPEVFQTSARSFSTFGSTTGNISCRGSPIQSAFVTHDFGSIALPSGCHATSDAFLLSSSDAAFTRHEAAWGHRATLSTTTTTMLEDIDTKTLKTLISDSNHILSNMSRISFATARHYLDKVQGPHHWANPDSWLLYGLLPLCCAITFLNLLFTCIRVSPNKQLPAPVAIVNTPLATAPTVITPPPYKTVALPSGNHPLAIP